MLAVPLERLVRQQEREHGRVPEWAARAPGRVNLIGEHTDYQEGLVLPCAIDRDTWAIAARRDDRRVRVLAADLAESAEFDASAPARRGGWIDYVQGVVAALAERGLRVGGLDLAVASQVPRGAGLSSSAALELAVVTVLDAVFELGLDARQRAEVAHRAESGFVGVPCGVMDQLASSLGRRDHALRIDCRSLELTPVTMPPLVLLVAHSGVERQLAAGGYRARVEECRAALEAARDAGIAPRGARALRDLGPDSLPALRRVLEPRLFRRARHVITENARVDALCEALAGADRARIGALLREGHASLRDDFEVSTAELDALCELADALPGVVGSRLTGAGFGGCTVHLVEPEAAEQAARALASGFERRFPGRRPLVLAVRASDGAAAVPL